MKRIACVVLLLSASALLPGSAHARARVFDFSGALRVMGNTVTVPPEWDGVWTVQDSVYDCTTGFKYFDTSTDTLCSGQVIQQDTTGVPVTIDCNGSADATSYHVTCTGSMDVFTDCQVTYDIQTDATRTSNSFRSVTTMSVSYSGTGTGCDLLPGSCTRTVSYGTRTGPAPLDYCLTPTRRTSWGQLKVSYR